MKKTHSKVFRKLGANRNELAHKPRKHDPNFAQSRDIYEDRGERKSKQFAAEKSGQR